MAHLLSVMLYIRYCVASTTYIRPEIAVSTREYHIANGHGIDLLQLRDGLSLDKDLLLRDSLSTVHRC